MSDQSGKSSCCTPARAGASDAGTPEFDPNAKEISRPTVVKIPGGIGLIGTKTPVLAIDGEAPLRQKRIKPFLMDETTVTNARFADFVAATGYVTEAERFGNSFVFVSLLPEGSPTLPEVAGIPPWWRVVDGATWRAPAGPGSEETCYPDHPVVQVTWNDAVAFAKWAGGRLPTEAEWEHAARGGLEDVRYPWGDTDPNDLDYFPCNIWQGKFPDKNLGLDGHIATAPAKSFEPNGYGLYNLVGNVWEYSAQYFKVKSLKKRVQQEHAHKKGYRLGKGGSFLCHASYCFRYRIAARTGSSPDSSTSHQGFRLVYDV